MAKPDLRGALRPIRSALTPGEQGLLPLLYEGLPYKLIGHQIGLTEGTVKIYAQRLFRKLGARDRIEFMARQIAQAQREIAELTQEVYGSAGAD